MDTKTYGYVRVSNADQNEARQIDAMKRAGVTRANLFIDKQSGKDFNRPGWKQLRCIMKSGDLLIVQSIDRLGRNYSEILEEWRGIVKDTGADIRVLDMPLLDTTNNANGLIGRFVSDIVLQILSFVAETERKNIRERQRQGIAAARSRGVRFGRPRMQLPPHFMRYVGLVLSNQISIKDAAACCGMKATTFWRAMKSEANIRRAKTGQFAFNPGSRPNQTLSHSQRFLVYYPLALRSAATYPIVPCPPKTYPVTIYSPKGATANDRLN